MKKLKNFILKNIYQIIGIFGFLVIWQIISILVGPFRLPGLKTIIPSIFKFLTFNSILVIQGGGENGLLPHLVYTFTRTLLGSFIGIVLGIMFGLIISSSYKLKAFFNLILEAVRTIPPLAAIPFFIMWFGPTPTAQLSMLIFYSAFMLLINTVSAVENIKAVYIQYAYTLGASKRRIFKDIIFPAITPELIGGIRVAIGISWGIQIVTELMGAPKGMGQVFSMVLSMQALDVIIVGIFWITILAAFTDYFFVLFARWVTRWMPS